MEKRKVFKISIIDKEISRTEFDRNTFYTSDSELTLVFKLIEKDYSYDHGEILLYNENDKSFVTRKVTKQENDFVYELDPDIIPHYGTWKAQLQLVKDGDVYTSKPFDFSIENDLSNLAPQPTLTDINNWTTLKQSANDLINEMQDIIADVEHVESERASKENKRQQAESERLNNEQGRKNSELVRENKEKQRQQAESKRENNEKQRRITEFERVDKETARQQAESQRQSTFETNEKERQTTFETAEQERQSAEIIRVKNENQRKIDHANRSAELAGKADKVVLKNEIENGNFSDGTTGWKPNSSIITVDDNGRLKVENSGTYTYAQVWRFVHLAPMSKYYFRTKLEDGNKDTKTNLGGWFMGGVKSSDGVYELLKENTYEEIRIEQVKFSNSSERGDYYYIHNVQLINLTETFGAGNEPTREEMSEIINVTGYIDGEYALNNKELLIWTLALIRSNKNAIVALGGA